MKKYRERSPQNVVSEIELLYTKYHKKSFYFVDDLFTKNKERIIELCKLLRITFPDITWRAMTRADLLDEELLKEMKGGGCNYLALGIESGSERILRIIQKGMTPSQIRKVVDLCHDLKIKVKGFFIFPLPWESEETFDQTLEFVKSLKLDYCDIYPLAPYPGTQLWNNPEKYDLKIIKPDNSNWDNYYQVGKDGAHHELKFQHPNFTTERILELINKFQKEVGITGLIS